MKIILASFYLLFTVSGYSQTLLKPDKVFDGNTLHKNWVVLVEGNTITQVGLESDINLPTDTKIIILKGMTLMPGIIEGHSHLLLHPYNETDWNDQGVA